MPQSKAALIWNVKWEGKNPDLMREWAAAGIEVPMLDKPPKLLPYEQFLLSYYLVLCGSRPPSMGETPAPIPISEIMAAYFYYDLGQHVAREDWARTVRELDGALIDHAKAESEKKNRQGTCGVS